jgi:hypothetical protein
VFGFTAIIWERFHKVLSIPSSANKLNIKNGILIHGGGWKKLESEFVDPAPFRK